VLNWATIHTHALLRSAVIDLGLPDFINFYSAVEAIPDRRFEHHSPRNTDNRHHQSGFIWTGNKFSRYRALIPINRQSGTNVRVIAQLHFYLDAIDPRGIGKPIFAMPPNRNPIFEELTCALISCRKIPLLLCSRRVKPRTRFS